VSSDEFSQQDIEFHRETATSYDAEVTAMYGVYHRLLLEPFLEAARAQLGQARALDLGCGTGVVTLALARRGFDVLGVDHSPEMLAIAEAKLTDADVPGTWRFAAADVRDLPADDGAFDLVTCQGLLHHLAGLDPALRELARVMRPGGLFYISEPALGETPLRRLLKAVWRLRRRSAAADNARPESVEAPINADALRAALAREGLEFDMQFLTHLPPLRRALPEWLYVLVVRLLSWPWRQRCGDLVFVFGRKPG
jgi:ubiquinone/menaquinone biosynthesis C-methylase UbiE